MNVNPSLIGRIVNAAGLQRAGRYTPWGYVDKDGNRKDGLIVKAGWRGESVDIMSTIKGDEGQALLDAAMAAVNESPLYEAVPSGRRVDRHIGSVTVTREGVG